MRTSASVLALGSVLALWVAPASQAARPWQRCSKDAGQTAARQARVPQALNADPSLRRVFFDSLPSKFYKRPYTSLCGDFNGDGRTDRALHYVCCTGSSPAPWVVLRGSNRGWKIVYKRLSDTTYRLQGDDTNLITTEPRYLGNEPNCCPAALRIGTLRWTGTRFRRTYQIEATEAR